MGKIKNLYEEILNCQLCYGLGTLGWNAPDGDFDFEYCECNPHGIPQDEVMEYNSLFGMENA